MSRHIDLPSIGVEDWMLHFKAKLAHIADLYHPMISLDGGNFIPAKNNLIVGLPFDVFLHLVRALDVWDILRLRAVWNIQAEIILKRRPLPYPSFKTRASTTPNELKLSVLRAAALERNLLSLRPRLRSPPKVLQEPTRHFGDPIVLLSGGRYFVTGATGTTGGGSISVWDLTTGSRLTSFEIRKEDIVLQWRAVDNGRGVMFLVRDGILSGVVQHYHLLRLEFNPQVEPVEAIFFHHSSLVQELPIADGSLSEDYVIFLGIDTDGTVVIFVFQWRDGKMMSIKTNLVAPEYPYLAILSTDALLIWVNSPASIWTYSIPLSDITANFSSPPSPPIYLADLKMTVLSHTANMDITVSPTFDHLYCDTTRVWPSKPFEVTIDLPLSLLYVSQYLEGPPEFRKAWIRLGHEYMPTTTDRITRPANRVYFAPLTILTKPMFQGTNSPPVNYPIICAESANVIFPEVLPSGEVCMRIITLPPDTAADRMRDPQWYNENLIRTLEMPPELDIRKVVNMCYDQATGISVIALSDGDIFILEY
ncbi:hypothetical protein Clacol_005772 [Clathrus columnatus]|uniref:F-box domain-containing protein n=1 Tax=Clathrus columnatus TaxID=1419009 RepID=A0AAV5ADH3_9AGAM|nr:hypothetical protein Clacol_005772 [Clathrus columnatus]